MVSLPTFEPEKEIAPFYHGYLRHVDPSSPIRCLEQDLGIIDERLAPFRGKESFRYAPEKWSVAEVMAHVLQVEQIFGYRLLRLKMLDPTPLPGFDENRYIQNNPNQLDVTTLIEHFKSLRKWHLQGLDQLDASRWLFVGTASGNEVTTRAQALVMSGHLRHHLNILHERYA